MQTHLPEFNQRVAPAALMSDFMKILANNATAQIRREAVGELPNSILAWGKMFLPAYFVHEPSLMHAWLGDELSNLHRTRGKKINVIGPRGSAKSTIATLTYVLRAAVERWERYIWIVSDTAEQAEKHLENVKTELLTNLLLAQCYPDAVKPGKRWRATSIELSNGVVIESFGTGQSIRGRRHNEVRPALIVCDDLQNDSHMSSAGQREASRSWFHGTLLNAGTHQTNLINLATALHREALALEFDRAAGWRSRNFPAIVKWPTNMELWDKWAAIYTSVENEDASAVARQFYDDHQTVMEEGAIVLWPAGESLYTLMQLRAEIGATAFDREKQGSPVNPENCEFPEAYFGDHIWFDAWPSDIQVRAVALDPSKGRDARRSDYSAFVLLGIDSRGVLYVEADMARRPTPQLVADGVAICDRFRPDAFGVEANQFQELLCGEFAAEFARQSISHTTPAAIHNTTNKEIRIRRLGPFLSQRRVRFLANSPSTRLLIDQLRDFPNASHDDGPDALEMALRLATDILERRTTDDGLGDRLPIST